DGRRAPRGALTARVVTEGLATWSGDGDDRKSLIVCGRAHLLEDVRAMEDLERVRLLFEDLDAKKDLIQLLGLAERADGVRIFIGSENKLFSLSGSALIVSPFEDTEQKIVGVLGVIGPTRLNYARIIPMVDYTARLLGRLVPCFLQPYGRYPAYFPVKQLRRAVHARRQNQSARGSRGSGGICRIPESREPK